MPEFVIRGARVFAEGRLQSHKEVVIRGDRIASIDPEGTHTQLPVADAQGLLLTPGLMDIHIHGMAGHDCIADNHAAIAAMAATLPRYGVTSFLPTAMTMDLATMAAMVRRVATETFEGATVLGCHLEGPFLAVEFKGAQEAQYMMPPTLEALETICGDYGHMVKLITLDPSAPGALDFIRAVAGRFTISAGHSPAGYDDAIAAKEAGLTHVTHCFNAMRPLHHREPGLLGAALTEDALTCEFIADLIHVHPAILRMAAKLKGKEKMVLISDAMMAASLGQGNYTLGGQDVIVTADGAARLASGNLAGSTLTLDKAVRNMVQKVGLPLEEVLPMATSTPAREIGEGSRRGQIAPGYMADLALWNEDLTIADTYIAGVRFSR